MNAFDISAFLLIEKINTDFKRFKGSRNAFAKKIQRLYGLTVHFWATPLGVVASVDYGDIIRLFEASEARQRNQPRPPGKGRTCIHKP
jgi:hypothetical protein